MNPKTMANFIDLKKRKILKSLEVNNLEVKDKCYDYIKDLNCNRENIINIISLKSLSRKIISVMQ